MRYNTEKLYIGDLVKHHQDLKWRNQTNRAIVIGVVASLKSEPVLEVMWANRTSSDDTNRIYQSSLELVARP
jgi:hypothetical protein